MTKNKQKFSGRTVFFYVLIFFGIFIAVDITFVTLAIRNHPGVVSDNAYVEGLEYNKEIAKEKLQKQLGWQGKISLENNKGEATDFMFFFSDAKNQPITGADILVSIKRPTNSSEDFAFKLTELEPGNYVRKIVFPDKGQWDVFLSAEFKDQEFKLNKRIFIPK